MRRLPNRSSACRKWAKPVKALVFLLVLANMLFYAFSEGYFGQPENPDGGRLEKQVQPDRMRIVSRGEQPIVPAKASEAVQPAEPVLPKESKPEPVSKIEAVTQICLAWANLSSVEADRLSEIFASQFTDFKLVRRQAGGEANGWWVYISALPGKAEVEKKASELRQFGVTDYFVIPDGPNRFAISLGVFTSEKRGQERLAEVKEKGVRSARLAPRPGKDGTVSLQAIGPAEPKATLLEAVGKVLPKMVLEPCK